MPGPRPADRMDCWYVAGISADQGCSELAGFLEQRKIFTPSGRPGANADGAWARSRRYPDWSICLRTRPRELLARAAPLAFGGLPVASDRTRPKRNAFQQIGFPGLVWITEYRDRRAEHDLLGIVCGTIGVVPCAADQKIKTIVSFGQPDGRDAKGFGIVLVIGERAQADISAWARVPKERVDE